MLRFYPCELDSRYSSSSELASALEYHIYKDGYGPTTVSLAEYMRKEMQRLVQTNIQNKTSQQGINRTIAIKLNEDFKKTIVM